jgi:hypothetical protein
MFLVWWRRNIKGFKMRILFAVGLLALVGSAQASPENVINQSTQVSFPDVGTVNQVSVGEQMLFQGTSTQVKGVLFPEPFKVASISFTNGFFAETGEDDKYIFLFARESDVRKTYGSVLPRKVLGMDMMIDGMKFKVLKSKQRVCVGGNCTDSKFTISDTRQIDENAFQQTLIYNGGSSGKIKIGYREFKDGLARAAFSNDIEYDLITSKTVAYKRARLEVLDADNTHIKYKILSNFNN